MRGTVVCSVEHLSPQPGEKGNFTKKRAPLICMGGKSTRSRKITGGIKAERRHSTGVQISIITSGENTANNYHD